jgi:hypothetical protein
VLQERPGVPQWLARMRGWFSGCDIGGTNKLRAYYGPEWLWEDDDSTDRSGYWPKSTSSVL